MKRAFCVRIWRRMILKTKTSLTNRDRAFPVRHMNGPGGFCWGEIELDPEGRGIPGKIIFVPLKKKIGETKMGGEMLIFMSLVTLVFQNPPNTF